MMWRIPWLSALAGAALLASQAAAAEPPPPPNQARVVYGDLDLRRATDAEILLARIKRAAHSVCGPMALLADINEMAEFNACQRAAVEQAVRDVGARSLTEAYQGALSPEQLARADIH